MKKVNISIAYEEEKYAALTMYLTQKNMSLETELTAALDSLYAKQVPQLSTLIQAAVLGVIVCVIGYISFRKLQKGFAEEL